MKTTKLLVSSVVALALSSSALVAEENGIFVGVGLGYGGSTMKVTSPGDGGGKQSLDGLSYEVIAGYKQFFTPNFGLRLLCKLCIYYRRKENRGYKA